MISSKFGGNATEFFRLNPGLYCDLLVGNRDDQELPAPSQEVNIVHFQILSVFKPFQFACFLSSLFVSIVLDFKQICLAATDLGTIQKGCKKVGIVQAGETCNHLYARYFKKNPGLFRINNRNTPCRDPLRVGRAYCLPT